MFTKFDKNLANYLVNNKIYIDCYSNNNSNSNVNGHNETFQSNIENNNTNNKMNNNNSDNDIELKNLTDEDDSVINSLPDMNEIESYDTDNNHHQNTGNCKNIPSPASSLSSSSSVSPSIIDSNRKHSHSSFKDYNSNSNSHDGIMPTPNKKLFNRNIHCVKEKIRRDRIKFSCNELRRLIPNLNGVKTDMASLLETSVLWIQLINSNIPEQLLINVQNKLESLKLLQGNKQYLPSQQQHQQQQNVQKSTSCSSIIDSSQHKNQPHHQKLLRNKNVSNETSELNLKQEIFNPLHQSGHQHITSMPSMNSSLNSSFISQLDANSPPSMVQPQSILPKLNPLEHHLSNNFMSKPSKWLSITQQKYSDLYASRAVAAVGGGNGSFQQQHHDQQDHLAAEERCFMNPNGQNGYAECDFYNKMTKKPVDFNNNNMYLGQVPYNEQLENYCQNQQAISIDPSEAALSNSSPSVYFQNQPQSALTNGCLF